MIAALALVTATLWTSPTADIELHGRATYMAPGRFEEVLANRGITLPAGLVPVALNRKGDLRRRVWLEWPDGTIDAAFVVDCAQRRHFTARQNAKPPLIAEVSAELAGLRGFYTLGPMTVTVWFVEPHARGAEPE